jgi:ferredoxin
MALDHESARMQRSQSVTFTVSGCTVECRSDQTLLEIAEAAGVPMPSSCRDGECGKCRARLLSGEVDMRHRGGIAARQVELGYVLTCCSRPLTDVVLER